MKYVTLLVLVCAAAPGALGCSKDKTPAEPPPGPVQATAPVSPPKGVTTEDLRGLWGSGPHDVWVVGNKGTILHYDGQAWTASKSGTTENLTCVYGAAANDVWAGGQEGSIIHWDGSTWSQSSHEDGIAVMSVWASGPKNAFAVGVDNDGEAGHVRKWDGTKWIPQAVPGSSAVWHIAGTGPQDVWMVGTTPDSQGLVLHSLNSAKFDKVGYQGASVHALWASRPGDVWAAPYSGPIQHWDGKTWTSTSTTVSPLVHVAGSGPDDIWSVGFNGAVLHYHDGQWSESRSGTREVLWSVWAASPNDAWIAGNQGTLLHWDGKVWKR